MFFHSWALKAFVPVVWIGNSNVEIRIFQQKPGYSYFMRQKSQYYKCRSLIGGNSIARAVNLCKLRCKKYHFRRIHFCPSLCLQVLFDERERMLHWFSYWFWWHFSVVSRFPWGEGRWTLFDICFYFSVPLLEGRDCLLLFLFFWFFLGG